MTWHYAPLEVEGYYFVCERFKSEDQDIGHTMQCYPSGDTLEELIQDVRMMLEDLEKCAEDGNIDGARDMVGVLDGASVEKADGMADGTVDGVADGLLEREGD